MTMEPHPAPQRDKDLRDAAWNAVAVASTHWQQSFAALCHVLCTAHGHGLTVDELVQASGIDRDRVVCFMLDAG
jgi:hypothetical protein